MAARIKTLTLKCWLRITFWNLRGARITSYLETQLTSSAGLILFSIIDLYHAVLKTQGAATALKSNSVSDVLHRMVITVCAQFCNPVTHLLQSLYKHVHHYSR